jgi:hypothetical protein
MPTRAPHGLSAVLGHLQPDLGQVKDLADSVADINPAEQITITARTDRWDMIDHPVRVGDLLEMPARMTGLAAWFATRRAPQALGRRL